MAFRFLNSENASDEVLAEVVRVRPKDYPILPSTFRGRVRDSNTCRVIFIDDQPDNLIFVEGLRGQGIGVFDTENLMMHFESGLNDELKFEVPRSITTAEGFEPNPQIIWDILDVSGLATPLHPTSRMKVVCETLPDGSLYYRAGG